MLQPGLHPVLDQILAATDRPAGGHLVDHQRHRLGEEGRPLERPLVQEPHHFVIARVPERFLVGAPRRGRLQEEVVQVASRVLADRRDVLRRDGPDHAVDLFGRSHHPAGDVRADRAHQLVARRRGLAVHHVPGQLGLHGPKLPLRILEREPQLRHQHLEPVVSGHPPGGPSGALADEGLDGAQLEDFVDGDQARVERDADDGRAVDLAEGAHARLSTVGHVRVESDIEGREAVADGGHERLWPFERGAVFGEIEQRTDSIAACDGDHHLAAQRKEVLRAVTLGAEEDLPALRAFQLLIVPDAVQGDRQRRSSAGCRRTSNRAPPCGRSRTAISPWCESMISLAM